MENKKINFSDLGINDNFLIKKLETLSYTPFPIQLRCIPEIINNNNIVGIASTGSGKTLSFVLPILNLIYTNEEKSKKSIIILPTRELVIQVEKVFKIFSKKEIVISSLYGGKNYNEQFNSLKKKPNIIIGTPGRIIDHINKKTLNIKNINILVIDESDEMLKMGFINDIKLILKNIENKYQSILFSATMPNYIYKNVIDKLITNYKKIIIDTKNDLIPNIKQEYCLIKNKYEKNINLIKIIEINEVKSAIIFVNKKISTISISNYLKNLGYNCNYLNGNMDQKSRENIINLFKNKKISILVATDIASRGIDIKDINLIINYDIPDNIDIYTHRIGRTGRAGEYGKSIIFINKEINFLRDINNKFKIKINKIIIPENKYIVKKILDSITNIIQSYNLSNDININYNKYKLYIDELLKITNSNTEKLSIILFEILKNNNNLYKLFKN